MDEILADNSKFELLDDDAVKLTIKRENQVKALLKTKFDNYHQLPSIIRNMSQ